MNKVSCNNLEAEMKRIGLTKNDIAEFLKVSYRTIHSRISGETPWLYEECVAIREEYFRGMRLDYLFPIIKKESNDINLKAI